MWPLHHGPFDQAGIGQRQLLRTLRRGSAGLAGGVQLAPGAALTVDQPVPADGAGLGGQPVGWHAQLFEVMKRIGQALVGQPGSGFFNRVAVRNAVNVNHWAILA